MVPFYFGTSSRRLFGIYHEAEPDSQRDHGVVLCHSFGREYILAHRVFRQLALRLTAAGFHVLRFDYSGCGDSSGESADGSPAAWSDDIICAAEELKDLGSVSHTSLVGLRLGASLAAQTAATHPGFRSLALWEPITSGAEYVEELLGLHAEWLRSQTDAPDQVGDEVLGFPLTSLMRQQLQDIDLTALPRAPGERVLLVSQEAAPSAPTLRSHLGKLGCPVDFAPARAPRFWLKGELHAAQIPVPDIEHVVSWLCEASA